MKRVYLVRHGENDMVGKRLAGRLPGVHLNEKGRAQALQIEKYFRKIPLHGIYASPLERTMETAAVLAEAKGLPVVVEVGLIEVDFGAWQGKDFEYLKQLEAWKLLFVEPASFVFPEGEALWQVQQRAVAAIEKIAAGQAEEETAACFTHGDVIRFAVSKYLNMALEDFHRLEVDTGSITQLVFDGDKRKLIQYNLTWLEN